VHPDVDTPLSDEDEKLVTHAMHILQKRSKAQTAVERLVAEKRLVLLGDEIRALAESRLRGERPRQKPPRPTSPVTDRPKTKVTVKSGSASEQKGEEKKAHPDAKVVQEFMVDLEEQLAVCNKIAGADPVGALRHAADLTVAIPSSAKPATRSALQALLDSIATTVDRVFAEADTLVVPKSAEQVAAEERWAEVSSKHERYNEKMLTHAEESRKSKTAIGKEYERSRVRHYREKKAALPGLDANFIRETERPGEQRTDQIKTLIMGLLDDMSKKAKAAFGVVGGKKALTLPEGTDGGVETMNLIIQGYVSKLNSDAAP
jgi:hypothetical protein